MNIRELNERLDCVAKLRRRIDYLYKNGESTETTERLLEIIELTLIYRMEKEIIDSEGVIKKQGKQQ